MRRSDMLHVASGLSAACCIGGPHSRICCGSAAACASCSNSRWHSVRSAPTACTRVDDRILYVCSSYFVAMVVQAAVTLLQPVVNALRRVAQAGLALPRSGRIRVVLGRGTM